MRRPFAALIALVVAACAPSSATPVAASDAAPSGVDAGAIDAAPPDVDADVVEAGATDAPSDAPRGPSHWCDAQPTAFCDDFDEDPLTFGWDEQATQNGALALDGASFVTPAGSFLATTRAIGAGGVAVARMAKRVTQLASEVRYGFDVRVDAADAVVVAAIELVDAHGSPVETLDVWLGAEAHVDENGADAAGAPFTRSHPFARPAAGAWVRIDLDLLLGPSSLDAAPTPPQLVVTVDGATAIDHDAMQPTLGPAFPFLFLGATLAGPAAPAAVRYDDVTLAYTAL